MSVIVSPCASVVNNDFVEVFQTPTNEITEEFDNIPVPKDSNECIVEVNNNQTEVQEIVNLEEHGLVDTVHHVKWFDIENSHHHCFPEIPRQKIYFMNQFANKIYPESGHWMSHLDTWLMMWCQDNLTTFVQETSTVLISKNQELLTTKKPLNFKV